MDTQENSCTNRDVLAVPPLDSPKQELAFYDLLWLIVGGGFLLSLIWDSWLLLVALVFSVYWYLRSRQEAQRTRFLRAYEFPAPVRERVRKRYPHLAEEQLSLVMLGLRQYFILCNAAAGGRVSMPSQVVDAAWHEFILFTREYADFCNKGLNRFLHHVPANGASTAAVSPNGANAEMKTTWGLACKWEGIDPKKPERLPFLFEIDARLLIPDGFWHSLDNDYATDGDQANEGGEGGGCGCGGCDGG